MSGLPPGEGEAVATEERLVLPRVDDDWSDICLPFSVANTAPAPLDRYPVNPLATSTEEILMHEAESSSRLLRAMELRREEVAAGREKHDQRV